MGYDDVHVFRHVVLPAYRLGVRLHAKPKAVERKAV